MNYFLFVPNLRTFTQGRTRQNGSIFIDSQFSWHKCGVVELRVRFSNTKLHSHLNEVNALEDYRLEGTIGVISFLPERRSTIFSVSLLCWWTRQALALTPKINCQSKKKEKRTKLLTVSWMCIYLSTFDSRRRNSTKFEIYSFFNSQYGLRVPRRTRFFSYELYREYVRV